MPDSDVKIGQRWLRPRVGLSCGRDRFLQSMLGCVWCALSVHYQARAGQRPSVAAESCLRPVCVPCRLQRLGSPNVLHCPLDAVRGRCASYYRKGHRLGNGEGVAGVERGVV